MGCLRIVHDQGPELRVVHAKKAVTSNYRTKSACSSYPFGMALPGRSYNFSDQSHAFQGAFARRDHDTRWDEFLLRNYDARIGQFLSVDPFLQYASPYVAMGNNPLSVVDPTGGLGMDLSPEVGPIEHRDYDYNWEIAFELVYGFGMNMYEARLLAMSSGVRGLHIAREMAAFGYEWKEGSGWGFWKKANFKDAQRHPPFRGLDKMNVLSTVTVGEQWVEVYNPLDKYWAASYEYKPMTERFYSQPRDFSNSKTALGAGGLLYGIGQNVMAPGDQWLGNNGKYYNKSWGGNKWTGSRSGALKIAKAAKLAGRATFFGGAAISISEGVYHGAQGNYAEIAKPGLDLGMGTAAAFGGPIGLTIGGFYLIIDVTIGWDNAMQSHGSITRQNQAILGPSWNAFRMEGGIR